MEICSFPVNTFADQQIRRPTNKQKTNQSMPMIAQLLAGGINITFTIRFATIVRLGDENSDKKNKKKMTINFPDQINYLLFAFFLTVL